MSTDSRSLYYCNTLEYREVMRRRALLLCIAACGRIHFEATSSRDGAVGDTMLADTVDAAVVGCAPLCGPAGDQPCCASLLVQGGTFSRSYDLGSDAMYTTSTDTATISSFYLDRYEVTVRRFREFVDAGGGTQASPPPANAGARTLNGMASQGGWDPTWNTSLEVDRAALEAALTSASVCGKYTWTTAPGASEDLPIVCPTWFEAFAFCAWDGGYLATEAEWNYAGAGGSDQRAYPWSSPAGDLTIDCTYANINPGTACVSPSNNGLPNRPGSESPRGDGRWGHADLSGNVWEWTLDWYANYSKPCNDCANVTGSGSRTMRGGSFFNPADRARPAQRNSVPPTSRYSNFGIRCARAMP
jgi:formylglycine-generating enzyme required for sulfatase activity